MTNFTDKQLVHFWAQYVGDPQVRIQNYGGFFERQLKAHGVRTVLDLGAGLGIDSIHLAQQGFKVFANEADEAFRSQLEQAVIQANVDVTVLPGHDWRTFPTTQKYDAAILIGNSFTYLLEEAERKEALRRFHEITDKVLVIDTRNYGRMLSWGSSILGREKFPFKKKFYYTGVNAAAYPIAVDKNRVILEIENLTTTKKYHLVLYPLGVGEMQDLLYFAGFKNWERFFDFSVQCKEPPDFIQFVATK